MAALAAALALGPVLGGWISQHLRWNWIFLVNLPAGLAGLLITRLAVDESRRDGTAQADWAGLICATAVMAAATFVLTEGPTAGWGSLRVAVALGLTGAGAIGFCVAERASVAPMFDIGMIKDRVLGGGIAASMLWGAGVNGVFFFTSLFLQRAAGFSATRTGLVFVPLAGLVVLVTPFTPAVTGRLGPARTVAGGLCLVAAGLAFLAPLHSHLTIANLLPGVAVIGIGSALTVPLTSSVLAAVPPSRSGIVGGMLSLAREASGLVGITLIGLIVTAGGPVPARGAVKDTFGRGYAAGLLAAAALAVVGAVVASLTLPGPPRES